MMIADLIDGDDFRQCLAKLGREGVAGDDPWRFRRPDADDQPVSA